jgi:hypothetical protein
MMRKKVGSAFRIDDAKTREINAGFDSISSSL